MKVPFIIVAALVLFASCSKKDAVETPLLPPTEFPEMLVTELNDAEIKHERYQVIDLDKDGINDLAFATWYIGDPLEHEDEILYFASSGVSTSLLITGINSSPRYNRNDVIPVKAPAQHEWYVVGQVEMAMKNIGYDGPPYWEKEWKDASHQFLAVQVKRDNKLYNGWVEVSMDTTNSVLILHRAAISKEPGRPVKAGI